MNFLFSIKEPVLIALTLVAYFLAFAQTLHVMLISTHAKTKKVKGALAYELLLVLHLLLICFILNSAHSNFGRILFRMRMLSFDLEPFLWVNAFIFALGLTLAIRQKKAIMAPELCILSLGTPPAIALTGSFSWLLLFCDLAFFLFRVGASVWLDLNRAKNNITTLSIAEALKNMNEGVLVSTKRRILFMNDAMRDELVGLGVGGHLMENINVWRKICQLSKDEVNNTEQLCFVLTFDNRTLMFSRENRMCGKRLTEQIVEVDVSKLQKLNNEIEVTNEELLRANARLSEELKNLEESCKQEAAFQMHKRVHDEIGQRLSILHQWLEGANVDSVTQDQIRELMHDITVNLAAGQVEPQDELASVINAFSQAGVAITIEGYDCISAKAYDHPPDKDCDYPSTEDNGCLLAASSPKSNTFSAKPEAANNPSHNLLPEILREAATNALKHGHAKNVWVNIIEDEECFTITITNDGDGAKTMPELGTGLSAMKKRIESKGGTFEIAATDPFMIIATFEQGF